ncbi:hypothetical protein BDV26DRAFT_285007 [Aspergillus bertholletiae]|uniref:Uncharacterized protein n=1 Tax=Aspergillus bertholletiae TaxID=1226010 RepID=A0A5N7AW48_9EURO|nr:hypothetical protein BDV26DRAFT_285007 [Aspergillus bertholletiae]
MGFRLNYHLSTGGSGESHAKTRYNVCQVFPDHQVPHVIWLEDALAYYGAPTCVFDLFILVQDIDLAADVLVKAGWTFDMHEPPLIGNAKVDLVDFPQQRLISPNGRTRTILLPATDWKYHFRHWQACQFSYLYGNVPALNEKSFAEQMKYEHRQFHFDVLAGMEYGTLPFRRHQRAIRDALLQGQYELQECSASRDK